MVGEDGEGNVVVSFDGGETQVSMRREDVQGMVDAARAQRWELLLDNDEQEETKATGEDVSPVEGEGVPSATTEGAESRGFELNDVVEVRGENGQMVQGYVTRPMNEDGLYEVFTDSSVGGLRSAYYAPEDMRLVEAKGVEGLREGAQEGEDGTLQSDEGRDERPSLMDAVRTLYEKGKDAAKQFARTFFDVARTPEFMKGVGLTGDRFTVRYGVLARHFGKDSAHDLPMEVWEQLPDALQKPFAISEYYTDEDKQQQKGYRIYTRLQLADGSHVMVSAEVKNAGRDVEVNAINTVFGRSVISDVHEKLVYVGNELTPEQQALLDGTTPHQYPDARGQGEEGVPSSEGKDSVSSGNGQGNVGENVIEMPMRRVKRKIEGQVMEVDEEDFEAVSPERTADYLYNEEQSGISREQADDFVGAKIAENEKVVKGIEARKPRKGASPAEIRVHKGKVAAELAEALPGLEYGRAVAAARDAVKEREIAAANERYRQERAAKEEAKRAAEVQRKEENGVGAAVRERWLNAPKVEGNADELTLANGEHVGGRYVLVESGAVSASHQAANGFARTGGFPMDENGRTVNDRDYERDGDAQRVTREIAQDYDARALQSPVVVSGDGVVLSGNGRTMAGELAALGGTDGAYVEHLKRYGVKYGFSREQVEKMKHPRVVFVVEEGLPYTAETFAKFNARETKAQSKTEEAVKMGKVVDDGTFGRVLRVLGGFETLGEFYGDEGAVREVVGELTNAGVVGRMDMGGLFDGEGVSAQGRELIENVLVGKAFEGDGDAVRRLTEMKSMRTSVVNALGEVLRNKSLGGAFDFMEELPKAVALVYEARKTGGYKVGDAVDGFALQYDMFGEGQTVAEPTDVAVLLLANAINDKRNTRLKGVLASYNDLAEDAAMGQGDIFSGFAQNKQSILEDVMRILQLSTPLTTNEHELSQLRDEQRDGEREQETQETDARAAETGVGETGASDEGLEDERGGIGEASLSAKIAAAEGEVDTNPSEGQKEAGNYKKGHIRIGAFDISIEQPKGSVRRGVDANGKAWESKMHNTYGYFRGTEGVDGDHIDVFVSNDIDGWNGQKVFVVDQYNPDGTFDEHKVMLGFNNAEDAKSDYLANYEKGWEDGRRLDVSATNLKDFEKWLASNHKKTKPFGEYKGVKREMDEVDAALKKELQDFIAQTDTMGRTAMDESVYDAEELFAPLLLDGKPSPLAVMTSVSDDINEPSVQIAVYDYSQEIDEKTNSGWQKWGNLADEYNAQAAEEDKGWVRGDTAVLGFRSVDAAVRFYDWVQHRDGVNPKFQVSGERLKSDTEAKQLATDVVLSLLESADVPVEVVSDEVAAAVLPEHAQLHMVYHGSGAKFDKFDHSHMGEGEGAQAFGWGSYVTEVEGIGRAYAQGGNAIKFRGFVLEETHGLDVKEHFSKSERKVLSFLHKWIALSNDVEFAVEKAKDWASNEYRKYSGRRDWSDQDYKDYFGATSRNEVREWRKEMKERDENAQQMLAFIETVSVDDFSIPPRHLYTVEIPDDRGKNYLHWDQSVAGKEKERIRIALTKAVIGRLEASSPSERQALRTSISAEFRHNISTGHGVYSVASRYLSPMEASGLLSSLGYTGISYAAQATAGGRADGARNYVIFKEHDLKITNHVEFMKTSQGTVYGWTVDGKIYLTRAGLNPETPIHEYTHLWAGAMRERNAEGWKSIKDLLQGSPMWEEVMHDPNYSHIKGDEDAVASEVLSRISGKENAKRFEEEAKKVIDETRDLLEKARAVMLLNNVRRAVKQFWNWVGRNLFEIKRFASIDEVTDRVLYDLVNKTNLKTDKGHDKSLIGVDNQGNLVDGEGRLVTEKVGSIDDLRDEDFTSPSRSVELPELDVRVADAIGTGGKPVVIKKNIFERNAKAHGDLTPADSRDILKAALYTPTLYGQNQKTKRPYNWVLIKTRDAEGENRVVLLEVNENKDNVEIVHWHYVRDNALETIKRQAVREGGPILILPSEGSEEAGGLSSRTNNLSSEGKVSESSKKEQGFDGKNGVTRLQKGDDGVAARDAAYADAVARGDMETAERMLAEEAARKGYIVESDYQGTSAFNGAAPSENGYYESLEERKAAFDEEDFEGDWSLADELVHGIEMGSLDFRLSDRELNRADRLRREAIQNLRNVRARVNAGEKDVRITMYRSVPAGVVEGEFRNGDWVTPSRLYAEDNAAVHSGYPGWENGYRIIEQEVPIEDVWWDGNDVAEWGYDNGREEVYKNVTNNRKSFSVTYDADGVLIPLSKRFDEGVSDVSYHKGDDVVVSAEDAALRDAVVELMRGAGIDVVVDSEEGQRVLDMENGGVRLEEDMERVNARFNDELGRYERGDMGENEMFHLGMPEGVMRGFLPELPIVMRQRVVRKASEKKHDVEVPALRNMPKMLAAPIFVFQRDSGSLGVLTEMNDRKGRNVFVAFALQRNIQDGGDVFEVNDIRSIHGREHSNIIEPIKENGTLKWVDKEKGLNWLSSASSNYQQEIDSQDLSSAAKVVKDFENPKLRVEKRRFFRTEDGKAYGFTVDGKVYLDPRMAGVETAVHEYTHLWADALRRVNPDEWRNVVELMKGTSVWDEVKRGYPELESEDEIADEVLAHYSGRRGAAKLRAALDEEMGKADGVFERAQVVSAFERVKRALARFWKGVADFVGVHFGSADEVADMVLGDLLRGRKLEVAEKGVSMVGRSLSAEEAKELVSMMEENAAPMRELELTRENWAAEFGADGVVQTPLGEVKMGEHQYEKLEQQGRRGKLGMVKPTLESPDVVIEDKSRAKVGEETERGSSYVFVKAFTKEDGERTYYFTSVTVSRDGKEVVVSNQEKRKTGIASLSQKGKVVWMRSDNASTLSDEEQGFYNSQAEKSELATRGTVNPQTTSSAAKVDKSSENGKGEDIFSMAERIAEETKREQRAQRNARYHREGGSVEYGQTVSRAAYEQRMASGAFQSREALQDSMLSLREAMDLILHEGKHGKGWRVEDVSDLENAYMGENRLSSVNSAEQEAFTREVFKPMLGAVAKLAETEEERMVLTDYLMAKHGLERNRVMAEREGLKAYETYMKKHPESEREVEEFIAKARERDYAGLTALTGVEEVSGAEMEAAKMVEEFEEKG